MATYIETISGKKIDFWNPDPEQIDVEDIVHALLNIPRFGGHIRQFYSVMTHSYNVSKLVPKHLRYEAIMHDAAEAYLMDMPTPFKRQMADYQEAEHRLWLAICLKLGINPVLDPAVKAADTVALMTERDHLKKVNGDWGPEYEGVIRAPVDMFDWLGRSKRWYLAQIEAYKQEYVR